jgi:hypothetical protein
MTDTKSPFASRTVWAGVVTVVAGLAGLLGHDVAPADADALAGALAELGAVVVPLVTALSGVATILGRLAATRRLG